MFVGIQEIDLYDKLVKYPVLERIPRSSKYTAASKNVINICTAFDIETTTIDLPPTREKKINSHAFMYVWQFQLDDITIMGRTWDECFKLFVGLADACIRIQKERKLETTPLLIIWVHNLSYEFQFLSGLYPFKNEECFFRDIRKPIYCRMYECLEFRCSYIQTNMSLSHLTKQLKVEEKLSGQKYDYSRIRYPWTKLSDYEIEYCTRDVKSLVACMAIKMQNDGDTLQTIPLTSTGYVRRDCLSALKPLRLMIKDLLPNEAQYRLLRQAFRGGNTHGSRKYSTKIVGPVYSYDMSSCYPAQQLTKKFPMTPFKWINDRLTFDRISKFLGLGYAVVGRYQFTNLRLKKKVVIPYLSLSRTQSYGFRLDNGRILEAEYVEVSLTEIDLKIVLKQYDYDKIAVMSAMVAQKHYLPDEYRKVIIKYYENKTRLKGVTDPESEYLYMKDKEKLNGIYGMSAQDPIHAEILYNDGEYERSSYDSVDVAKVLGKAKFPYQWGVYTTAYAREALQEAIDIADQTMVYCDTDSIKTIGKIDLSLLNKKRKMVAERHNAYADDAAGNRHYMGVFELDAVYEGGFVTCGAKRYAYIKHKCKYGNTCPIYPKCQMGVTVSGVSKAINEETGFSFAVEELEKLENFKVGFIWRKSAGTMAVYNDTDNFAFTDPETGNTINITKNVAIVPATYEMKFERDYTRLLQEIDLYGEYKRARE